MEDFFKQQAEWLNTWQEQQQSLAKEFAKWGEDLAKGAAGSTPKAMPTNFEDLLKTQQTLFEQFSRFGTELQQNIQKNWGEKLPADLLQQFNFNVLQEFYKSWLGTMKFPGGIQNPFMGGQNWTDPSSFLNSFMKQDNPFLSGFSGPTMVNNLQQMFGMLQGSSFAGKDIYSQLFSAYQGFFNQFANTTSRQGFDQLLQAFTSWKEQADKYLLAPQVGIHRETAQDFSKAISLSLDFIQSYTEMSKLVEETTQKAGNRFQAKLFERGLNNESPIKFMDFCKLWTQENEAVFLQVFGSEEYAKAQRGVTSAGLRLKMQVDGLVEKVLDQTPVALKRDVDLAAKEIIEMKRATRQSKAQTQELMDAVNASQEKLKLNEENLNSLKASFNQSQTDFQTKAEVLEASLQKALEESQRKVLALEASFAEAQKDSQNKIATLEAALTKVQRSDESAKAAAKTGDRKQGTAAKKAAASPKKSTASKTKKTPKSAAKTTKSPKSATTTRRTKKPAGSSAESSED